MAKRKARVDAWLDETVTAPRQFVPNPQENKRAKFVRRYVWFATVAFLPATFVMAGMVMQASDQGAGAGHSVSQDGFDQSDQGRDGQAKARLALNAWLGAEVSPLPTARVLSFDGSIAATPVAPATVKSSGSEKPVQRDVLRMYRYSLATANGTVWLASVPVGFSDLGAIVADIPSVMPAVPASSTGWSGQTWPGERTVTVGQPVNAAVETWAKAYASGDPEQLRLAVGDKDAAHAYLPVAGATYRSSTVGNATVRKQDLDADGNPPASPNTIVARVGVSLSWPGQDSAVASSVKPVMFDVLITDANTASPRVVAWGPSGQGGALKEYGNAITSEKEASTDAPGPVETNTDGSPKDTAASPGTEADTSTESGD